MWYPTHIFKEPVIDSVFCYCVVSFCISMCYTHKVRIVNHVALLYASMPNSALIMWVLAQLSCTLILLCRSTPGDMSNIWKGHLKRDICVTEYCCWPSLIDDVKWSFTEALKYQPLGILKGLDQLDHIGLHLSEAYVVRGTKMKASGWSKVDYKI